MGSRPMCPFRRSTRCGSRSTTSRRPSSTARSPASRSSSAGARSRLSRRWTRPPERRRTWRPCRSTDGRRSAPRRGVRMGPEDDAASRPIARRVRAAIVAAVAIPVVLALAAAAFVGGGVLRRTPTPTLAGGIPQLIDETASSGLSHTYGGDLDFSVGGGVAVLDCNDDGRPDLYLPGGERPAELFRNDTPTAGTLRFARLPDAPSALADVNGAYPIDIDGDGRVDLAVLRNGGNRLLRGLGDCRFEDATEMWGLDPGSRHTEAFSATWEPGAMWPTIALGNYVDPASTDPATWCEPNQLVGAKVGGSGFGQPTGLTPSWCALSMLFSDWDGSGRMDLRVSNDQHYYPADRGEEQLWRIEPAQRPRLYTAAEGWVRVQVQGMGIGSYDVTGDSLPEVFLTSQAANLLQTLT